MLRALRAAGTPLEGASVFEAGFGVGYYMQLWSRLRCGRVAGVDISPLAVANVRSRFPHYDLRVDDVARIDRWADWPQFQESFAIVTAIDLIYHLPDEDQARHALVNLAELVAPGGILLVTEKLPASSRPDRRLAHVMRRPLHWYQQALASKGLALEHTTPVFWCMDPPIFDGGMRLVALSGYMLWVSMRAAIKFWPTNSRIQNAIGQGVGAIGALLDHAVTRSLARTPNLTIVTFRKR